VTELPVFPGVGQRAGCCTDDTRTCAATEGSGGGKLPLRLQPPSRPRARPECQHSARAQRHYVTDGPPRPNPLLPTLQDCRRSADHPTVLTGSSVRLIYSCRFRIISLVTLFSFNLMEF
jgi:hypothetical protein